MLLGDDAAQQLFRAANPQLPTRQASELWRQFTLARECQRPLDDPAVAQAAALYAQRKSERPGLLYVDYADLLDWWLEHVAAMPPDQLPQHVLVDEVQDLSPVQLAILRRLLPGDGKGFFGIGDPDQAIYGFRGVSGQSESSLRAVWPDLSVFCLGRSFRSSQDVLNMARSLLHNKGQCGPLTAARQLSAQLRLFSAPDQQAEIRWVTRRVQALLGATAHTLLDQHLSSAEAHELDGTLAPGDIAVLVRLRAQIAPLRAALEQAGIPCAAPAEDAFWQDAACARLLAMAATHCGLGPLAQSLAAATGLQEVPAPATAGAADAVTSTIAAGLADTAAAAAAVTASGATGMAGSPLLPVTPFGAGASLPAPEALEPWLKQQAWAGEPLVAGRAWRELKRVWKTHGNWTEFLAHLGWLQEAEMVRGKAEHVQIMTMHASKGLEFQIGRAHV